MIRNVYVIYDVKINAANSGIILFNNDEEAKRSLSDMLNKRDENNLLYLHPEDFQLRCIGRFDDVTCVLRSDVVDVCMLSTLVVK